MQLSRHLIKQKKIDPALWIFLLYFAILVVFYLLSPAIVGAVILGLYLSMIIMVPARLIARIKFINQKAAVIISAVLVFTLLSVMIMMIFPIIIDEAVKLFTTLSEGDISVDSVVAGLPDFIRNLQYNSQVLDVVQQLGTRLISAFSTFGMGAFEFSSLKDSECTDGRGYICDSVRLSDSPCSSVS